MLASDNLMGQGDEGIPKKDLPSPYRLPSPHPLAVGSVRDRERDPERERGRAGDWRPASAGSYGGSAAAVGEGGLETDD